MKTAIVGVISLALVVFALIPAPAHAFMGFGGTVLTMYAPGVACEGEGPITILPKGPFPAGPYAPYPLSLRFENFVIKPGAEILGVYLPFLTPGICWTTTPIPVPVPVFPIVMFGTSF